MGTIFGYRPAWNFVRNMPKVSIRRELHSSRTKVVLLAPVVVVPPVVIVFSSSLLSFWFIYSPQLLDQEHDWDFGLPGSNLFERQLIFSAKQQTHRQLLQYMWFHASE